MVALRFARRWGPHRIGYHLGIPRATVGRVLDRYGMPLLRHLYQKSGLPVRAPKPVRYERSVPGELFHVDIKKPGRIPGRRRLASPRPWISSGPQRWHSRDRAARQRANPSRGYRYLHHAVDDHRRLAQPPPRH